MSPPEFICEVCGRKFSMPQHAQDRFPGWKPRFCREHTPKKESKKPPPANLFAGEENLSLSEVLARYSAGPQSGIFTDGSARPNPGPGGWGIVYVQQNEILRQDYGHEPNTTNNRMELTALIKAYQIAPRDTSLEIFTDSELCVNTMTQWAPQWEQRGWKRKTGPIKNLGLVQELYGLYRAHPLIQLRWIEAHNGWLWNEYADSLATAWARATP